MRVAWARDCKRIAWTVFTVCCCALPMAAQATGGATSGGTGNGGGTSTPAPPTTGGGNTGGGGGGTTPGGNTGNTSPFPNPSSSPNTQNPQPSRPIFLSGDVRMADGTELPNQIVIERICGANNVRAEGYADSKGRFSFQLGQNMGIGMDASNSGQFQISGFGQNEGNNLSDSFGSSQTQLMGCELRARAAGYRSETISLAGRMPGDSPNIGTIFLYPLGKIDGTAVSVTSARAPKDARKAYEKGVKEAQKQKFESAQELLVKAVTLYPQYAAAWLDLGKVYEHSERWTDAREAYEKSIAADKSYVYPYDRISQLNFREQNWEALAASTDQLLRLNPYEFPVAHYLSAVANYQLKHYDTAEHAAREAIQLDARNSLPKAHMMLGYILVATRDLRGARTSFANYLAAMPNATDKPNIVDVMNRIDKALGGVTPQN